MALKDAPELEPFILKNIERTGRDLGCGSFGSVEELKFNQAPCAGKKIHEALIDTRNVGTSYLVKKFEQECRIMKELRYPHIVQFMGLCFFDDSKYPMIVMELLDNSVEEWLCSNTKELPISLKFTILQDTAKGLNYLHTRTPPIIHRDITARNILLTSSMKAKIADLGNARIISPSMLGNTLTRAPGTACYMPPEALDTRPKYAEKLDIFSFGHLSLFVVLQNQPHDLLASTYFDPKNPNSGVLGRSEIERRKKYFDELYLKFSKSHEVSIMIQSCLHINPQSRPSADELIKTLDSLRKEHKDDYEELGELNRFAIAEKLKEYRDKQTESPARQKLTTVDRMKAKIKDGEPLILSLGKAKGAFHRRPTIKWKMFTFLYKEDDSLKYFGDLNRPALQDLKLSTIEMVKKSSDWEHIGFVFEVHYSGKVLLLKASNEEEGIAWMEVLKSGSSRIEAPSHPPPPLPPYRDDIEDNADAYVQIHEVQNQYMKIEPEKRDLAQCYTVSHSPRAQKKKPINPPLTNQTPASEYLELSNSEEKIGAKDCTPEVTVSSETDGGQLDDATQDESSKRHGKPRLSRTFHPDQIEVLLEMMHQYTQNKAEHEQPTEGFYDEIEPQEDIYDVIVDPPPDDSLYDEIPEPTEIHPYVNYASVVPSGVHKYQNVNDEASKPTPVKSLKPVPLPKPRKSSRKPTSSDILRASSQVSTNMLIVEDDTDSYETVMHRPEWAKASLTPVSTKELGIYGIDDDVLELLRLSRKSIQNLVPFASGQFGQVYKAVMKSVGGEEREVAIKMVKHESEKEKENFIKEMKIMSKLLHPNIIRLYGLVIEENWIVLEYMANRDLGSFLKKNYRPVFKLLKYMMDVAMGMHYISNLGLIHRDIAARNILLDHNETCKVADFGLVREMKQEFYPSVNTTELPLRWCAPETISERIYYPASDVWSYGVLLWEMANPNKIPYEEYGDIQFIAKVTGENKTLDIPQQYPETVKQIMKACWQKNPKKRPSFVYISMLLTNVAFAKDYN